MDGRRNNKGKTGNSGGNPGYGKISFIINKANQILPEWWTQIRKMMKGKDPADKRFALQELNKIQVKLIPTQITGEGGNPIEHTITGINYITPNGDNIKTNPKTA